MSKKPYWLLRQEAQQEAKRLARQAEERARRAEAEEIAYTRRKELLELGLKVSLSKAGPKLLYRNERNRPARLKAQNLTEGMFVMPEGPDPRDLENRNILLRKRREQLLQEGVDVTEDPAYASQRVDTDLLRERRSYSRKRKLDLEEGAIEFDPTIPLIPEAELEDNPAKRRRTVMTPIQSYADTPPGAINLTVRTVTEKESEALDDPEEIELRRLLQETEAQLMGQVHPPNIISIESEDSPRELNLPYDDLDDSDLENMLANIGDPEFQQEPVASEPAIAYSIAAEQAKETYNILNPEDLELSSQGSQTQQRSPPKRLKPLSRESRSYLKSNTMKQQRSARYLNRYK